MDFFAVDKNKAVVVNVPIMFVNEDICRSQNERWHDFSYSIRTRNFLST